MLIARVTLSDWNVKRHGPAIRELWAFRGNILQQWTLTWPASRCWHLLLMSIYTSTVPRPEKYHGGLIECHRPNYAGKTRWATSDGWGYFLTAGLSSTQPQLAPGQCMASYQFQRSTCCKHPLFRWHDSWSYQWCAERCQNASSCTGSEGQDPDSFHCQELEMSCRCNGECQYKLAPSENQQEDTIINN